MKILMFVVFACAMFSSTIPSFSKEFLPLPGLDKTVSYLPSNRDPFANCIKHAVSSRIDLGDSGLWALAGEKNPDAVRKMGDVALSMGLGK